MTPANPDLQTLERLLDPQRPLPANWQLIAVNLGYRLPPLLKLIAAVAVAGVFLIGLLNATATGLQAVYGLVSLASLIYAGWPLRQLWRVVRNRRAARSGRWRRGVALGPDVLVLLDPSGGTRWVRSGLDLPWLNETVETVALDPCGAVVLAGAGDPEAADWGSLWVTKLDRSAEPRWSVFLPSPYFHRSTLVHGLYIEPDGGVLGTGAQVTGVQDLDGDTVVLLDAWAGRLLP